MAATNQFKQLFTSYQLTPKINLKHRIVMAPMTRTRCTWDGLPTTLQPTYYQQRTSDGGLLISEGFQPSETARGYIRVPSLYTKEHSEAWKPTVNAVKEKGGFIFAQLMHPGRVGHSTTSGTLPVAPSPIPLTGKAFTKKGQEDYEVPRELKTEEIPKIVDEFVNSAELAIAAGFDGIEIHGGNGYLFQQFHATQTNKRNDKYGGSVENRTRFTIDVVDAISQRIGSEKVAIRLQPGFSYTQISESPEEVKETYGFILNKLNKKNIAYLHVSNFARLIANISQKNEFDLFPFDVEIFFRENFNGTLMINSALDSKAADEKISNKIGDLASFGSLFISNPDLVDRIKNNKELNLGCFNKDIWYGKDLETDAVGFIDWPNSI